MINRTRKKQTKINGDKENNLTVLEKKIATKEKCILSGCHVKTTLT
jgi:hypothetical protein